MRLVPIAIAVIALAGAAEAKLPLLNATCPGGIEVHADEGGPVYINGKQATLKKYNDNSYDAINPSVTISITVNPDGSVAASYTGPHKANGICQVAAEAAFSNEPIGCPDDVSEADRYKYPACN